MIVALHVRLADARALAFDNNVIMLTRKLIHTWLTTRDFSSKYVSVAAPSICILASEFDLGLSRPSPALRETTDFPDMKILVNFPNRLELLLSTVLAFPNASRIGFVSNTCCSTFLLRCGESEPLLQERRARYRMSCLADSVSAKKGDQ
jgi:hypothetical protein